MQQQSFRFYDIDPEQLSFDFPLPEPKLYCTSLDTITSNTITSINGSSWGVTSTLPWYFSVLDSDGVENTRMDTDGLHIRVPKKTWLKTKIANYLGINYLQ